MPVPVVTCNADVVIEYDSSSRLIQLNASATESPTSWLWTILSVPPGSTAMTGTKGDFVNGYSTDQNPKLEIDGGIDGGYCLQAMATNGAGSSNTANADAQQLIIVRTESGRLWLSSKHAYDWGEPYLNPTLRALESGTPVPWFEWNGTDLSQFDTEVLGRGVSGHSVSIENHAGVNWISMYVDGISFSTYGADYLIDTSVYLPISATPPSADYIVVADVYIPTIFHQFSPTQSFWNNEPEDGGAFVGTRVTQVNTGSTGYFHGITGAHWESDTFYFNTWGSLLAVTFKGINGDPHEGASEPILVQVVPETLNGLYERWHDCPPHYSVRLAQGTEHASIVHGLSDRHYQIVDTTDPPSTPITDVGKAVIGVFSSDSEFYPILFRNIRCYNFPWNFGS